MRYKIHFLIIPSFRSIYEIIHLSVSKALNLKV